MQGTLLIGLHRDINSVQESTVKAEISCVTGAARTITAKKLNNRSVGKTVVLQVDRTKCFMIYEVTQQADLNSFRHGLSFILKTGICA